MPVALKADNDSGITMAHLKRNRSLSPETRHTEQSGTGKRL